ncbi:hypothetical protein D9758_018945 [Tetrapyrgos nigripes]|uniref:Uncharacterized protein n=1 Tax=Tetrapyrgos nigripes TaxID=182062 RepID=A0A8H5AVB3_9AGAR|nr:hypothetical protein D9758_018945 [Tetrapyrgos nigripes]
MTIPFFFGTTPKASSTCACTFSMFKAYSQFKYMGQTNAIDYYSKKVSAHAASGHSTVMRMEATGETYTCKVGR